MGRGWVLQVLPSEHADSADVSWENVCGAKAYTIDRAADAPNPNGPNLREENRRDMGLLRANLSA